MHMAMIKYNESLPLLKGAAKQHLPRKTVSSSPFFQMYQKFDEPHHINQSMFNLLTLFQSWFLTNTTMKYFQLTLLFIS